MTGSDRFSALEQSLRAGLAWEPSEAALGTMDRRVGWVIAAGTPGRRRFVWPQRRLLVLLAAGLLLLGAASAATLLQRAAELDPRWRAAYEQAEHVNLTDTVDGYSVTLERAYADRDLLVLAVSLAGPADTFPAGPQLRVTDETGREYRALGSGVAAESASGRSGSIHAFAVPVGANSPLGLTIIVEPLKSEPVTDLSSPPAWFSDDPAEWPIEEPGLVGPWTFHLTLDVRGGGDQGS